MLAGRLGLRHSERRCDDESADAAHFQALAASLQITMANRGGGRGEGRGGYRGDGHRYVRDSMPDLVTYKRCLAGREELFNKHIDFEPAMFSPLSPSDIYSSVEFVDADMMKYKDMLNATKSQLDDKDFTTWKSLTKFTNQTGDIVTGLRKEYSIEMCTNAWVKMFELLTTKDLMPLDPYNRAEPVATAHVCEAPGAFIAATNHYLRLHRRSELDWRWMALSLNPYFEGNDLGAMIDDDALIMQTYKRWYFGRDNSGNILVQDNIRGIWEQARKLGVPIRLTTGDGGVDSSDNPNEQEATQSSLHYAEAITMLGMLAPGGNAVLKMFTLFEHESISLVYLMGTLFRRIAINKPSTSTAGNSETYLLMYDYQGCPPALLEKLLSCVNFKLPDGSLVPREHMSDAFMKQMRKAAYCFANWQKVVIDRNLSLEKNKSSSEDNAIRQCKANVKKEYIERCHLERISPQDRLAPDVVLDGSFDRLSSAYFVAKDFKAQTQKKGTLEQRQLLKQSRKEYLSSTNTTRAQSAVGSDDEGDRSAKIPKLDVSGEGIKSALAISNTGQASSEPVYSEAAKRMLDNMGLKKGITRVASNPSRLFSEEEDLDSGLICPISRNLALSTPRVWLANRSLRTQMETSAFQIRG